MIVSREKLQPYVELLLKWNKSINLISKFDEIHIWERHIMDSLQLMNFIDKYDEVVDVGSGAGLPGMVLSISGVANVTLIESDSRKAAFLLQAALLSDNKVLVHNNRVESLKNIECDWVVSRAFATLDDIFRLTKNIKIRKGYLLLKGENYKQELEVLQGLKVGVFDSEYSKGKILKVQLSENENFFNS